MDGWHFTDSLWDGADSRTTENQLLICFTPTCCDASSDSWPMVEQRWWKMMRAQFFTAWAQLMWILHESKRSPLGLKLSSVTFLWLYKSKTQMLQKINKHFNAAGTKFAAMASHLMYSVVPSQVFKIKFNGNFKIKIELWPPEHEWG